MDQSSFLPEAVRVLLEVEIASFLVVVFIDGANVSNDGGIRKIQKHYDSFRNTYAPWRSCPRPEFLFRHRSERRRARCRKFTHVHFPQLQVASSRGISPRLARCRAASPFCEQRDEAAILTHRLSNLLAIALPARRKHRPRQDARPLPSSHLRLRHFLGREMRAGASQSEAGTLRMAEILLLRADHIHENLNEPDGQARAGPRLRKHHRNIE